MNKKSKIIIFEGLDNTGKSTQINNIMNRIEKQSFHTIHYSAIKGNNIWERSVRLYTYMFKLFNLCIRKNINLLVDRAHLGEFVYGPIYRKYKGDYVFNLEKKYIKNKFLNNIYLIVLIDNPSNLIKREDNKSLHKNSTENILYETERFIMAFDESFIKNKIIIDINNKSEEEVYNIIKNFINF